MPGSDRQPQHDHERRAVEHVVGEHVPGLVAKHAAQLLRVEQLHELGVDDYDRLPCADRQGVGDRELREIEVRHRLEVERRVCACVGLPDVAELILAQAHRRAEDAAAQCALVAELDDLADDRVEVRDRLQRCRRGSVGGMLIRLRRDPLELIALDRKRHGQRNGIGRSVSRDARRQGVASQGISAARFCGLIAGPLLRAHYRSRVCAEHVVVSLVAEGVAQRVAADRVYVTDRLERAGAGIDRPRATTGDASARRPVHATMQGGGRWYLASGGVGPR